MIGRTSGLSVVLVTLCLLVGACQALYGEDGKEGPNGPQGQPGLDGQLGPSAALDMQHCLGCITDESIQDGAVAKRAIANGAVTRPKIKTGTVTAEKIAAGAVTSTKIVDGAVTSAKIADGAVQGYHISSTGCAAGSTAQCGQVLSSHIRPDSVIFGKLAPNAVEAGDIQNGAVSPAYGSTAGHIASGAVGPLDIADQAVTAGKIADGSIGTRHVQAGALNNIWNIQRHDLTNLWDDDPYLFYDQTAWIDLSNIGWNMSNGHGGLLMVRFNGSFYSYGYYGNANNCYAEIRLVAQTSGAPVVLARQNLSSAGDGYYSYSSSSVSCEYRCHHSWWCGCLCYCYEYCYPSHSHLTSLYNILDDYDPFSWTDLGSTALSWTGEPQSSWQRIKVQWRKIPGYESSGQYLFQGHGDAVLTIVEFNQAALNPAP